MADGQRAYDAGDLAAARAIWGGLAARDDAVAMQGLGLLADLGRGEPQDEAAALRWYQRAGGLGLAAGAFNAAVMLDAGRGGPRDAPEAALWYARAAAAGDHRAQYDLAQLYATGDGLPQNPVMAARWFTAARQGGLTAAEDGVRRLGGLTSAASLTVPSRLDPAGDADLPCPGSHRPVPLVWAAPPEPASGRFYVEVVQVDGARALPVISAYTDVSAVLVDLPAPSYYAWRVYAVDTSARAYAPSPWQQFHVGASAHRGPASTPAAG